MVRKKVLVALAVGGLSLSMASPVFATGGSNPPAKCNAGRGNASESTPQNDCDPGNSGAHNQGGD